MWLSIPGYEMWLNKLNYGTFSGKIDESKAYTFSFLSSNGDTLRLDDFKGRYLILDCWYTYCGICYQKMPKVQELYNKYKEDNTVSINALHCRIKKDNETAETGNKILTEKKYTLPCFSIEIENPILKELGVNVYPTVLVFDKESHLIFRGDIEEVTKLIGELMEKEKLQ